MSLSSKPSKRQRKPSEINILSQFSPVPALREQSSSGDVGSGEKWGASFFSGGTVKEDNAV
jgi:hypothetical protein